MPLTKRIGNIILLVTIFITFIAAHSFAEKPVIFFSDLTDAPKTGWDGSDIKGAAVSIWGLGFGSSRGISYITCGGQKLTNNYSYAEWAATTKPTTARGLQRITFFLNSSMSSGKTTITVTTPEGTSNSIDFFIRDSGKIFFVSTSGDDSNDGTRSTNQRGGVGPWRNPYKAKQTMTAGSITYIRSGIYTEYEYSDSVLYFIKDNWHNGTENNSIGLIAYPGEEAQIGDSTTKYAFRCRGSSITQRIEFWTLSKLTMVASYRAWSWGTGSDGGSYNVRIIGLDSTTAQGGSSVMQWSGHSQGAQYIYLYGNYAHDAGVDNRGDNPSKSAYGLYVSGYGFLNHIYIGWNEFSYNKSGRGIQIYGHKETDKADNIYVHDNYIHSNGKTGAILGGGDSAAGIEYEFLKNCYFYNNIVTNNGGYSNAYGGLRITGGGKGGHGGNFYIYNNVFYENFKWELDLPGDDAKIFLKNNIFHDDGDIDGFFARDSNCSDPGGLCESNNDLYYGGADDRPAWAKDYLTSNPRFLNASNDGKSSNDDFRLMSNSPGVNSGTPNLVINISQDFGGIKRPQGSDYDIGAHEFNEGSMPVSVPAAPSGLRLIKDG